MKKTKANALLCLGILSMISCGQSASEKSTSQVDSTAITLDSASFSQEIDGHAANLYTLKNASGATAYLTNFGARLVGLLVPDKEGTLHDVVLGFDQASLYHNPEEPFFGTIVGPFGNRIAKGKFTMDGQTYTLPVNNGPNTLHGGFNGVHFRNWEVKNANDKVVTFTYEMPDGQDGFPGAIQMEVSYSLSDNNELTISYQATTDKKTIINLTNHAYFNMNGEGSGSILDHQLKLYANQITPVDSTLIPTGALTSVEGTPFDFTSSKTIGQDIEQKDEQLKFGGGYDHNFVLSGEKVDGLNHAATVIGDKTGIVMDIFTQEPGIQFYSGNFMADKVTLKSGTKDSFRTGFCLEPQHFPDSPNQPSFPSTVLNPGDTYATKSVYKFTTN